jgi:hypothetical protein
MLKKLSLVFGVVFLAVGILGFVPGVTNDQYKLLGIFQVSGIHNWIHILSGVAAILGSKSDKYAQLYFRVFGIVYAAVTVIGFIQGDTVLGIFDINMADNWLHTVLAVVILAIGFGVPPADESTPVSPINSGL